MKEQRIEKRREKPRRIDPRKIPQTTATAGEESGEIRDVMAQVKEAWKTVLDRRGDDRRQDERRVWLRRSDEMQPEN